MLASSTQHATTERRMNDVSNEKASAESSSVRDTSWTTCNSGSTNSVSFPSSQTTPPTSPTLPESRTTPTSSFPPQKRALLRIRQPEELLAVRNIADSSPDLLHNISHVGCGDTLPISPPEEDVFPSHQGALHHYFQSSSVIPTSSCTLTSSCSSPPSTSSSSSSSLVPRLVAIRKRLPVSPATNSAYTMLTSSPPTTTGKKRLLQNGCIMWVHLQASICTEWEQSSMVLNPGSQMGATVTTSGRRQKVVTSTAGEGTMTPTTGISSILQALTGTKDSAVHHLNGHQNKKPKTIHRCILQRVSRSRNQPPSLKCHVCDSAYGSYDKYLNHLLDSTCAKKKEERDASAASGQIPVIVKEVVPCRRNRNGLGPGRPTLKKSRSTQPHNGKHNGRVYDLTCAGGEITIENELLPATMSMSEKQDKLTRKYKRQHSLPVENNIHATAVDEETVQAPHGEAAAAAYLILKNANNSIQTSPPASLLSPPIDVVDERLHHASVYARAVHALQADVASNSVAVVIDNCHDAVAAPATASEREDLPLNLTVSKPPVYDREDEESALNSSSTSPMPALMPIRKRKEDNSLDSDKVASLNKKRKLVCAHKAAATLPPLSLVEHAADQAKVANLKVLVTNMMVSLFGEARLTEMGYPEKDILILLKSVLEAARANVEAGNETCGSDCEGAPPASGQVKFRELRLEIGAARRNVRRLLEICYPDTEKRKWSGKTVEEILEVVSVREHAAQQQQHS